MIGTSRVKATSTSDVPVIQGMPESIVPSLIERGVFEGSSETQTLTISTKSDPSEAKCKRETEDKLNDKTTSFNVSVHESKPAPPYAPSQDDERGQERNPMEPCYAQLSYDQVKDAGPASNAMIFDQPKHIRQGICVKADVFLSITGKWLTPMPDVIHRIASSDEDEDTRDIPQVAYMPIKDLQSSLYGEVVCCAKLRRYRPDPRINENERKAIRWEVTDEKVAVKKIDCRRVRKRLRIGPLVDDPLKELAALQYINDDDVGHPNITSGPIEILYSNPYLYSVIPFYEGGEISELLEDNPLNETEARNWFNQILSALDYMQSRGICHRDLSLENIMIHKDRCVIIDFGMCLKVPYTSPHVKNEVVDVTNGTRRRLITRQYPLGRKTPYFPPEIYAKQDAFDGFAVDLWYAACVLYYLLTEELPFGCPGFAHPLNPRFSLIAAGRLRDVLPCDVHLSDKAVDLLQRMFKLDPGERLNLAEVMGHNWFKDGD